VRIHDGILTAADVTNNYDLEKAEFVSPIATKPILAWRNPTSGRVIEFGDIVAPATSTKPVSFTNLGTAPFSVTSYAIVGPDAARYSTNPALASLPTGDVDPAEKVNFDVTFTPTNAAETTATLQIVTSIGTANITLRGNVTRIYLALTGDDVNGNGTVGAPYFSLNHVLSNVAEPGDVIQMAAGVYGASSAPDLADGSRQFRVVGVGNVVIDARQNSTPGFDLQSSATPGPTPPTPPNTFPAAPSAPTVYEWNDSTAVFENITIDATLGTTDGADEPLNLNGNGTFDVTLRNSELWNAWGVAAIQSLGTPSFVRLTADNSSINGLIPGTTSDTDNNENISISLNTVQEFEVNLTNCDVRGGENNSEGNVFHATARPSKFTASSCRFGTMLANEVPVRILLFNVGGGGNAIDVNVNISNCLFVDWTDVAIASAGRRITGAITGSFFTPDPTAPFRSTTNAILVGSPGGLPVDNLPLSISDCLFEGLNQRHVSLVEGINSTISNNVFLPARGAALRFQNATGDTAATFTVVGNTINTGSTTTVDGDPAAVLMNYTEISTTTLLVSRNTVVGTFTGNSTPTQIQHGTGVKVNGGVKNLTVANNVIEGSDFGVWSTNTNNATTHTLLVNNTIIGLADAASSIALRNGNTTATTALMVNNIILGYPITTNVATPTSTTNVLAGDPLFVNPRPFAAPATAGLSNYRLFSNSSPAYGTGTAQSAAFAIDRAGVDRLGSDPAFTGWDIGAYQFNPAPNPVKTWQWY
jgi:hypothetical protein